MRARAWQLRPAVLCLLTGCLGCEQVNIHAVTETPDAGDSREPASVAESGAVLPESVVPGVTDPSAGAANAAEPVTPNDCAVSPLLPGDTNVTLQVGDETRSYVLHVPEAYDGSRAVPLIVDFHGMGASGQTQATESPYPKTTDPEGVIMTFPDGLRGPLGTAWNFGPCCVEDVDDLAFARALVTDVRRVACIDPARVYAVGVLTGGGMVHHLACGAADVFAAVAPAAFDLLEETSGDCRPSRPISVVSFRGTEDARVPYIGGPSSLVPGMPITFLGAAETAARWAEINGCTGTLVEDTNGCASYSECLAGVDVILCTELGGREAQGNAALAWPLLARHAR